MNKCGYVSSAGLRVLLMLAKHLTAQDGHLALVGVCPEIKDVMEMTGFINFFKLYNTLEEVLKTK
jgi:anti-anti-sigma factor